MQVKHLDHLNLTVKSFEDTRQWYGRIFGFALVEEGIRDGQRWGVLKAGEALLCVYESGERRFLDGEQLAAQEFHGVNHFSLRIQDRAAWEKTVQEQRLRVHYGGAYERQSIKERRPDDERAAVVSLGMASEYPHSTSWYVNDPTGYEIEVVLWKDDSVRFGGSAVS